MNTSLSVESDYSMIIMIATITSLFLSVDVLTRLQILF